MPRNKATSPFRSTAKTGTACPTSIGTTSIVLFQELPYDSIIERIIHNPSTTAIIAYRLLPQGVVDQGTGQPTSTTDVGANAPAGTAAAVNTGGSITVAPGATHSVEHTGLITGIANGAASPITVHER
jgi:hypothetical protein